MATIWLHLTNILKILSLFEMLEKTFLQGQLQISEGFKNQAYSLANMKRKTELGTKTTRSQFCIISSISGSSTLTFNIQVLNPYYTLSGIILLSYYTYYTLLGIKCCFWLTLHPLTTFYRYCNHILHGITIGILPSKVEWKFIYKTLL